jgi:hypothetical protein
MHQGDNLIFLVSQPRVGSTMLQRILGAHPDLHTMSEPWLVFQALTALREGDPPGSTLPAQMARRGVRDFIGSLPGGEDAYREGVRRMYGFLYEQALLAAGKPYFVDKTPWYSLIVPELALTFPRARFLILFRNPLAAFVSFIETWIADIWKWADQFKPCILDFPRLLLDGRDSLQERAFVVRYEELVRDPAAVVQGVCNWLRIDFRSEMVDYGRANLPVFPRGDPHRVYQHVRPTTEYVDAWQARLADPQMWRWVSEYLEALGPDTVEQMGYSYMEMRSVVNSYRPLRIRLAGTLSLTTLLDGRAPRRVRWAITAIRWRRAFWHRGVVASAMAVLRRGGKGIGGQATKTPGNNGEAVPAATSQPMPQEIGKP